MNTFENIMTLGARKGTAVTFAYTQLALLVPVAASATYSEWPTYDVPSHMRRVLAPILPIHPI